MLRIERTFAAPADEVFDAWTSPEVLRRWFHFVAATKAALVLAAFRAPYRGRSTPVNAWWGSFDLAVNLFSGDPADPPADDFIMRNAMDAQEVAVGWWPGARRTPRPRSTPTLIPRLRGRGCAALARCGAVGGGRRGVRPGLGRRGGER